MHRPRIEPQTDFTLAGRLPAHRVEDLYRNAGQRPPHRTALNR
jgi:hypothetical protein